MTDANFKQAFAEYFYELWDDQGFGSPDDHFGNAEPWGRPWLWGMNYPMLEGPRVSARVYFDKHLKTMTAQREANN